MFDSLLYEVKDGVAIIQINRPEVSNAFSEVTYGEIADAMHKADADANVKAVIITGVGKTFCAGGDVKYFSKIAQSGEGIPESDVILTGTMVRSVKSNSKPVVAAVNGVAAGAGAGLALACDFLVFGENTKLLPAFTQMAFPGDTNLIYLLQQAIGNYRTTRHVMLNEPITAELAREYGIAYDVVADGDVLEAAMTLAEKFNQTPSLAIASQKSLMNEFVFSEIEPFNEKEAVYMNEASLSGDHKEAVQAFMEKRKPTFKGM